MMLRIWGRVAATAVATGALVGAGQLGVAYGLGIVDLARSFGRDTGNLWNAELAWVCWFALLAVVGGAAAGERVVRRNRHKPGLGTRILLALLGGVGAMTVIPLSVAPARSAELTLSVDPALVVGLAAGLGAVAGVLVAIVALSLRPLAWNLVTVAVVVWLAALAAVGPHFGQDDVAPSSRLGVPRWTVQVGETDRLVEMLGMPVLTLLAGMVVAAVARGRRQRGISTAICGTAGAVPLALAYLIAGPGTSGDTADQMAPYLGGLIAIPAGLLGSLLVSVVWRRDTDRTGNGTGPAEHVEPTAILPSPAKAGPERVPAPSQRSAPPAPPVVAQARVSAASLRPDDHVDWVAGLGHPAQGGRP